MSRFNVCFGLVAGLVVVMLQPVDSQVSRVLQQAEGAIFGRVIDASTAQPVNHARVQLDAWQGAYSVEDLRPKAGRPYFPPQTLETDSTGAFAFNGLAPGSYRLVASAAGFTPGAYGRGRVDGQLLPLVIALGEHRANIVVPVWKLGAIEGDVADGQRNALEGLPMVALRIIGTGDLRRFLVAGRVVTDATGAYRIDHLTPGRYVVLPSTTSITYPNTSGQDGTSTRSPAILGQQDPLSIRVGSATLRAGGMRSPEILSERAKNRIAVYPSELFPSTFGAIEIESGGVWHLPVQLQAQSSFSVSGALVGPDGPIKQATVRLVRQDFYEMGLGQDSDAARTVTTADGHFTFLGVAPGRYEVLYVQLPLRSRSPQAPRVLYMPDGNAFFAGDEPPSELDANPGPLIWGRQEVDVADAPTETVVTAFRGYVVRGTVKFDGSAHAPGPELMQRVGINLIPAENRLLSQLARATSGGLATASESQSASLLLSSIPVAGLSKLGGFVTAQVPPGKYFLRVASPNSTWSLASVAVSGQPAADALVDLTSGDVDDVVLTFRDDVVRVVGSAQTSQHGSGAGSSVVLFPADYNSWAAKGWSLTRWRVTTVQENGQFSLTGVPPGDYLMAVINPAESVEERDLTQLRAIASSAKRVRLTFGANDVGVLVSRPPR